MAAFSWGVWGVGAPKIRRVVWGGGRAPSYSVALIIERAIHTDPSKFIWFGMAVTKPYEFAWFGAMDVTDPS